MNYSGALNDYRYLRDGVIMSIKRNTELPLRTILKFTVNDLGAIKFSDFSVSERDVFDDFLFVRSRLVYSRDCDDVFLSQQGNRLTVNAYRNSFSDLLKEALISEKYIDPVELNESDMMKIFLLSFYYARPRFQMTFVLVLLCIYALRPSEVARLIKSDIMLDDKMILLRSTKGGRDDFIPIIPVLHDPFSRYISYIKYPSDPLFVSLTGTQWTRREVTRNVAMYAESKNIFGVTAQRIRPTVAKMINCNGASIDEISELLRHKDPKVTRRYAPAEPDDVQRTLEKFHPLVESLNEDEADEDEDEVGADEDREMSDTDEDEETCND